MLFRKNKLEGKQLVRIYKYVDVHRGYGDGGTFKYIEVDSTEFKIREHEYTNGDISYIHSLDLYPKYIDDKDKLYGLGYELGDVDKMEKEKQQLKNMLETGFPG